jgi:peptide chain release factor 1
VRITHKPSGLVVVCCDEKSQKRNKDQALEVLRTRLYAKNLQKSLDKENNERRQQIGLGQRSEKTRTYRFQDDIVVDHKTGKKVNLSLIIAGNIDILR